MNREPFIIYPTSSKKGDTAIRMLEPTTRLRMADDPRETVQVRLKAPPTSTNKSAVIVAVLIVLIGVGLWSVISHFRGH